MVRSGPMRCLVAAALFGASAPVASRLADDMPAATLAGLLYLGAAAAVGPAVLRRPPSRDAVRLEWRAAAIAVAVGGGLGPVLLMSGLARTDAASASLLLNLELVATAALAAAFFGEHVGGRVWAGVGLVALAGALLGWQPGVGVDGGALLVVAACACWGLDNCITARIEHLTPQHVVASKGLVAGTVNVGLGLAIAGGARGIDPADVATALLVGAAGYGMSITLWVQGARELGAARAQLIFSTAPFIGAIVAWSWLGHDVTLLQVVAGVLAAAGVVVAWRAAHHHRHEHREVEHEHDHVHDDDHHDHVHAGPVSGRHSHRHVHGPLVHAHAHVPDLHHRHDH